MSLNKKVIHRDVLFSTIMAFVILFLLKFVIVNTEYLNPLAQVFDDFQFTDLYYSEYKKTKTEIDTNIVLVNIGENDRLAIAGQLDKVNSFGPKFIGLDVTFKSLKTEGQDSILKAALGGPVPIISVCNILYEEQADSREFVMEGANPFFGRSGYEGYGNFLGEDDQTVRYYTPFLNDKQKRYPAFATRIVQTIAPQAYDKLLKRGHKTEIINYRSANYPVLDVCDFEGSADLNILRNKVVLMGYMGPDLLHKVFEDNHLTPLNKSYGGRALPDKYGIEIHANIVSMLLGQSYINESPGWLIFICAFFVCMAHMYIFIYLFVKHHKWFHVGAICLQIISFALIVLVSLFLFGHAGLKLEPAYILVGVLISIESLYFYEALVKVLHSWFNFQSCFVQKH